MLLHLKVKVKVKYIHGCNAFLKLNINSRTMAGTEETLKAPGPITRLKLEQVFQCDVCKVK